MNIAVTKDRVHDLEFLGSQEYSRAIDIRSKG